MRPNVKKYNNWLLVNNCEYSYYIFFMSTIESFQESQFLEYLFILLMLAWF